MRPRRHFLLALNAATPAHREALTSTGTGFFVTTERIVTNNHATEGCARLRIGGKSEGRLVGIDPRLS